MYLDSSEQAALKKSDEVGMTFRHTKFHEQILHLQCPTKLQHALFFVAATRIVI